MSIWEDHDLDQMLAEMLGAVTGNDDAHHLGRPWTTAYQLSARLEQTHPEAFAALGGNPGGEGTGQRSSVPQKLANQLSRRILHRADYPIEGAFLSNDGIDDMTFTRRGHRPVRSTLTRDRGDLSMFRLRG